MRFDGHLKKWNDERGFGFIAPSRGGDEVFVHISSFPRDGSRPRLDEPLTFEIDLSNEGKKRAIKVLRPARVPPNRVRRAAPAPPRHARSFFAGLASVPLIGTVGAYGYVQYLRQPDAQESTRVVELPKSAPVPTPQHRGPDGRCDGRTRCSQMTSCAEATFFLNHCPSVEMDGDHDGVPCERQWCGG